ncbi:MAG: alpha/beta fold hydrolase [Arenicellales bacterium]
MKISIIWFAVNPIASRLVKTFGIFFSILLISGCGGGSEQRPCARSEDACLVPLPPPIDYWWDVPITDFSDNPNRPTISLLGDRTQILTLGDVYLEAGATALDMQDGDISSQISINGQVDSSAIGDYLVRYAVADSSGTVAIEQIRIVRVIGNTAENLSRRALRSTIANFGYLEHLPVDYGQATAQKPPLLIYLHGGDANLEFTNTTDPTLVLDAVINNYGVPKLIEDGQWDDTLPFVVLAPQLGAVPSAGYRIRLEAFLEYAVRTYDIDTSRIYLTGYSLGGFLSAAFSKDYPDRIAAVASVSPAFPNFIDPTMDNFCDIGRVPFWMFHATNDAVIPYQNTLRVYNQILDNCQAPILPKLSLVLGAEHAIHHAVYNLEALVGGFAQAVYDSQYDSYDVSVYQWLLSHSLQDR